MITENEKLSIIQWIIETEDEEIISRINAIKNDSSVSLSNKHKEVLNSRLKRYADGTMEFSSWEDVKRRVSGNEK